MDANVQPDEGPPDAPAFTCPSDGGACADPNVPGGWTPIALTTAQATCPTSFGAADQAVTDAMLGANACTCGCMKTQDPDCQTGSSIWSGVGMTCASGASSIAYSSGLCRTITGTVDDYDKATTIAPTGGVCTVQTLSNDMAITTTPVHLCVPNSACSPAACGGFAPPGFTSCIVTDGDVTCPSASVFSSKRLIAAQFGVQCTDCGTACTLQGSCKSPQLSFYSDSTCTTLITSIPADGTCDATGHNGAVVQALKYTATPDFTGCMATNTSTGTLQPQSPRTVCCRP